MLVAVVICLMVLFSFLGLFLLFFGRFCFLDLFVVFVAVVLLVFFEAVVDFCFVIFNSVFDIC